VLDGSAGTLTFQIGAEVGQTISISLGAGAKTSQLGQTAHFTLGDISGAFQDASGKAVTLDLSKISLTDSNGKAVSLTGTASSPQDFFDAINAANVPGLTLVAGTDGKGINIYSKGTLTLTDSGAVSSGAAVTGSIFATAGSANGSDGITLVDTPAGTGTPSTPAVASGTATVNVAGSLERSDVLSVDNSNVLITRIDAALSSVSTLTSNLGAIQNRFQSTISTLSAERDNLKASQSTIQDADFATETSNLSKAQILQQAGISVLSQANTQPQQVLKLLQ
jgi:flagellin